MLTTTSGKTIRMDADEIRETGRNAKGVRIIDARDGDKVIAVEPVMSEEQEQEIEEAAPSEPVAVPEIEDIGIDDTGGEDGDL